MWTLSCVSHIIGTSDGTRLWLRMSLRKQTGKLDAELKSLVSLAGEIDQLRGSIQEIKFSQGDSEEAVEAWSAGPYLGFFVCGDKLRTPSQGSSVYKQGF